MIKHRKRKCKSCEKMCYTPLCTTCKNKEKKKPVKKTAKKPSNKVKYPKTSILKKHAYDVFSLFVRLRDSNAEGKGKCITCDRVCFFYDDCAQNGHFRPRAKMSTTFHEQNNNLQCSGCNGPGGGMYYEYGKALDIKYGKGSAEELDRKSKQEILKYGPLEYMEVIEKSLKNCDDLLKKKRIHEDVKEKLTIRLDFYRRFLNKAIEKLEN